MRQLEQRLARDFLTSDTMINRFVTREEIETARGTRREWWPVALAAVQLVLTFGNLILIYARVH